MKNHNHLCAICFSICLFFCFLISCSAEYENINQKGQLVHTVILDLKDDILEEDRIFFVEQLKSLGSIKETHGLFVASYVLTNDDRAKTDYDVILQMTFNSEEDLFTYANNQHHLDIRATIKDFLAKKPIVYDYLVE